MYSLQYILVESIGLLKPILIDYENHFSFLSQLFPYSMHFTPFCSTFRFFAQTIQSVCPIKSLTACSTVEALPNVPLCITACVSELPHLGQL